MKICAAICFFMFTGLFVHGQEADSVSAMLIRFHVKLDIKESLAELAGKPDLLEFYYIIKDDVLFIKEIYAILNDDGFFRCFDIESKIAYTCLLDKERVSAIPISYPEFGSVTQSRYPDSIRMIEGYPCKQIMVSIDGVLHEVWSTTVFGTHFSTIGDIPGIPLYYEKTNSINGKLKFLAVDVKPIRVPAYYFDLEHYKLISGDGGSGRRVYTAPQKYISFSHRLVEGGRVSSSDTVGKVMFLTFWDPVSNNLSGDINTLNQLKRDFEAEDVSFIALNKLKYKKAIEILKAYNFDFNHAVNAGYTFEQFGIGHNPAHIIIDKKGYLRYRYNGVFGKPLYGAMKLDIESLLSKDKANSDTQVK